MKQFDDIFELCDWEQISPEQAEPYGYGACFSSLGMAENGEDLFGEVPEFYLHRGDIELDESITLNANGNAIFIVDGNLIGPHTFCFYTYDAYTFLLIRGNLVLENYVQGADSQLGVLGSIMVKNTIWMDLSDAGFFAAQGAVNAACHWVGTGGFIHVATLAFPEQTKSAESDLGIALDIDAGYTQAFLKAYPRKECMDVAQALTLNIPVLNTPCDQTWKKLSKEQIAAMSVETFLRTQGFVAAILCSGGVNPAYVEQRDASQKLKSLTIGDETYIDAFPPELDALEELKLSDQKDAERLAHMLKSLPTLRNLKSLRMSFCALPSLPAVLFQLPQLETLELIDNTGLGTLPAEIAQLQTLKTLHVSGERIELPESLAQLDGLETLIIRSKHDIGWPAALESLRARCSR